MEEIYTLIPARHHSKDEEHLQKSRASLIGRHLDMQGFMFYEKNCSLMIQYDPRKVSSENLRQVAVIADVLKNHPEHDITAIEAAISARLQKKLDVENDQAATKSKGPGL